jgi:hypothetical protein
VSAETLPLEGFSPRRRHGAMYANIHTHPSHPPRWCKDIDAPRTKRQSPPKKETRTDGRKRNVAVNRNTTHALQSSREGGIEQGSAPSSSLWHTSKKGRVLFGTNNSAQKTIRETRRRPYCIELLFVLVGRGGPRSQIERERMKQLPAQQTHKEKEGRK